VGLIPAPSALPLPSTVRQTSIPTSAVADVTVVEIFVSVKRPVTKAGLISRVVPFPLGVEMLATNTVVPVAPLRVPPVPMLHDAGVPAALKLPLLWANANPDTDTTARTATAKRDANFLMVLSTP